MIVNPKTGQREDLADAVAWKVKPARADDSAVPVFGKVSSGEGDTYLVDLYAEGPDRDSTATVTVKIVQIDASETIDPGTWLSGIQKIGNTYWCQPPVWIP